MPAEPQIIRKRSTHVEPYGTFREALRLGHDFVGTEHVLLALLELEAGTGVLAGLGVDKGAVESTVTAYLAR